MLVQLVGARGRPTLNIEVSSMRRVVYLIALLALVLGGPVPVAASMAPMVMQECLEQCGALDRELPPCCAVAINCQVKSSEPRPYVGTNSWAQAATKNPIPAKEPNPCPSILAGITHQLPPVQVKTALRSNPRRFAEGLPKPLSRACVLRI